MTPDQKQTLELSFDQFRKWLETRPNESCGTSLNCPIQTFVKAQHPGCIIDVGMYSYHYAAARPALNTPNVYSVRRTVETALPAWAKAFVSRVDRLTTGRRDAGWSAVKGIEALEILDEIKKNGLTDDAA